MHVAMNLGEFPGSKSISAQEINRKFNHTEIM